MPEKKVHGCLPNDTLPTGKLILLGFQYVLTMFLAKTAVSRVSRTGTHADVAPELSVDSGFQGSVQEVGRGWCYPLTLVDRFSRYCLARAELWHIRPHACNIDDMAVGCALAGAELQPGQIAVVAQANAMG